MERNLIVQREPLGLNDHSRIFWHKDGSDFASANEKTIFAPSVNDISLPKRASASFRDLFLENYERVRDWCLSENRRGIALVALGDDSVEGAAFVASKPDTVATALLGRHTRSDLRLRGDPSVSLRHLALLVYPRRAPGQRPRYRLLDLRTAEGFLDERGKRLRAIDADGPAFIRCGRHTLLFFPVEENDAGWPEAAEAGWEQIPERLYIDEVETEAKLPDWEKNSDRAWEADELPQLTKDPTLVHSVAGPEIAVEALLAVGEEALGELHIASPRGRATVVVGRTAARAGILLGRSRRCDAGRVLLARTISRVHLLVIEIAGTLYAIDTASSNGTFSRDGRERVAPLDGSSSLSLGDFAVLDFHASSPRDA